MGCERVDGVTVEAETRGGGEVSTGRRPRESAYVRYPRVSWFEGRTRRLIDCETRGMDHKLLGRVDRTTRSTEITSR